MLQEVEVFDCLTSNLRQAAEDCGRLAWDPRRGYTYLRLLKSLREIEGCCRQVYYLRDYDSRWLLLSQGLEKIRGMSGAWLRDAPSKEGRKVADKCFQKLSELLLKALHDTARTRTAATFKLGPILPEMGPAPHRDTRPVQVITPGGIILPDGVRVG